MGLKIMTKSKNQPTKWQFFHENHQLGKVVEMKGTDGSFVPVGFSRIGTERLKNRSGKCEGPTRGDRRVKEPEREMRRTGQEGGQGGGRGPTVV
jgi:hypothetical protein